LNQSNNKQSIATHSTMVNSPVIQKKDTSSGKVIEATSGENKVILTADPKQAELSTNPAVRASAAIAQGGQPHNEQIIASMEEVQKIVSKEQKENKDLDVHGKKLAEDIKNVTEASKKLLEKKNYDELFQQAVAETTESVKKISEKSEVLSVQAKELQLEAEELMNSIRSLTVSFVTSGEIRGLVAEVMELFQMLWKDASLNLQYKTQGVNTTDPIATGLLWPGSFSSTGSTGVSSTSTSGTVSKFSEYEYLEKLKKVLIKIAQKKEFQEVISNFKAMGWIMKRRAEMHGVEFDNRPFKAAKRILRRFSGEQEFRKLKNNFWDIWEDLIRDEQMVSFFGDLSEFAEKAFTDVHFLESEAFHKEATDLMQRARTLTTSKEYLDRLILLGKQVNDLVESIKKDETLVDFKTSVDQLVKDFGLIGPGGQPDLIKMTSGIDQLKMLLLPVIKKMLEDIPLAKIELYSRDLDLVVEDVFMNGGDILPEMIRMNFDNRMEADLRAKGHDSSNRTRLWVEIRGIKPVFKHFKFWYNRKTFPKLEDKGLANLLFKGNGIRFVMNWELNTAAKKETELKLRSCKCYIDSIDIQVLEAEKHSLLDKIGASIMEGRLKRRISGAIENFMYANMESVNTQINTFFKEKPFETLIAKATTPSLSSPVTV